MSMSLATPWPGCQIRTGTNVLDVHNNNAIRIWTPDEFAEKFGRVFDAGKDFCAVMNGDGNATFTHVEGSTWIGNDGLYAVFDREMNGLIRINWLVVLAP